jgi:hypothetical protein
MWHNNYFLYSFDGARGYFLLEEQLNIRTQNKSCHFFGYKLGSPTWWTFLLGTHLDIEFIICMFLHHESPIHKHFHERLNLRFTKKWYIISCMLLLFLFYHSFICYYFSINFFSYVFKWFYFPFFKKNREF